MLKNGNTLLWKVSSIFGSSVYFDFATYSPVDLLCGEVMQLSVAWLLDFDVSLVCCGFILHAESLRKRFVPFVHLHLLFLVGSVHQVLL